MDSESHLGIELQEDNKIPKKSCKFGKVVVGITGATALGIVLVNVAFVTQALRKIFLPMCQRQRDKLLILLNRQKPLKGKDRRCWIWALAMGEWQVLVYNSFIIPNVEGVIGPLHDRVTWERWPCVNPVYTYPDIFESATLILRIKKYSHPHVAISNQICLSTSIRTQGSSWRQ